MRAGRLALATTVALAAVVAAAPARGATIDLQVDSAGDPAPLFAGSVTTLPHAVDGGDGSGPHPCSGPPGSPPAATATGALDDALRGAGIPWRGNWNPNFHDFFVDAIGPYASAAPDRYWSLTVNGRFASGGCLALVEDGDSVRFHYGSLFGDAPTSGPAGSGATGGPKGEGAGPASSPGPSRRMRRIAARADAYLRRNPEAAGADWGRLALAVRRGSGVADAARALLGARLQRLRGGSIDRDVNATAIAVLALRERRPRVANRAARWLASAQGADGGFGFQPAVAADLDTTALATWVLARARMRGPARGGAAFVLDAQNADGGFPSLPGGDSNAQSSGLALVALRVAGFDLPPSSGGATPADYLSSLARPNGSIAYAGGSSPTPVWTTAQALLGLTSRLKLLGPPAPTE